MVHLHSGILVSHEKEENPSICHNVDETCGRYAKRNASGSEREMLCDLTFMWNFKRANVYIRRLYWWSPEAGTGGWETLVKVALS